MRERGDEFLARQVNRVIDQSPVGRLRLNLRVSAWHLSGLIDGRLSERGLSAERMRFPAGSWLAAIKSGSKLVRAIDSSIDSEDFSD